MFPLKDNIPTRRFPYLTVAIIVANVLVFFVIEKARLSFAGASVDELRVIELGANPVRDRASRYAVRSGRRRAPVRSHGRGGAAARRRSASLDLHPLQLDVHARRPAPPRGQHALPVDLRHNIEDSMGRLRFVVFYLCGGPVALAAQAVANPDSMVPTVGASGAVAAVLGGYALL